ncbi:MAG TPA: hypothetical protein VFF88_00395, partial [Methylocella sp.]|nr:hypothetical protein [Methylocella sp.]
LRERAGAARTAFLGALAAHDYNKVRDMAGQDCTTRSKESWPQKPECGRAALRARFSARCRSLLLVENIHPIILGIGPDR